jgi:hypothetical protein
MRVGFNRPSSGHGGTATSRVVINPNVSDTQLARKRSTEWRCSSCGHVEQAVDAETLREQALAHYATAHKVGI